MSKVHKSEYNGHLIETYRNEGQEYVQRGQFAYYRQMTDWSVKVDGKLIDSGYGTKKSALRKGQQIVDRM